MKTSRSAPPHTWTPVPGPAMATPGLKLQEHSGVAAFMLCAALIAVPARGQGISEGMRVKVEVDRITRSGLLGSLQSAKLLQVPSRFVVGNLLEIGPAILQVETQRGAVLIERTAVQAVFVSDGIRSTGDIFANAGKAALISGVALGALIVVGTVAFATDWTGSPCYECSAKAGVIGFAIGGGLVFVAAVPIGFLFGREKWRPSFLRDSGAM